MRTIKFRGKSLETDDWVYGFLADGNLICTWDNRRNCHEVLSTTVGQFTGLLDKNGKEIYEGDIVEYYELKTYCVNPDCEPHLLGYGSCIRKVTTVVEFSDCIFGVDGKYGIVPLSDCGFYEEEIEELKEKEEREEDYFDANGYEIGDSIIGIRVIGNIHDNPNMIE